jgi:hypothetical protein
MAMSLRQRLSARVSLAAKHRRSAQGYETQRSRVGNNNRCMDGVDAVLHPVIVGRQHQLDGESGDTTRDAVARASS